MVTKLSPQNKKEEGPTSPAEDLLEDALLGNTQP